MDVSAVNLNLGVYFYFTRTTHGLNMNILAHRQNQINMSSIEKGIKDHEA